MSNQPAPKKNSRVVGIIVVIIVILAGLGVYSHFKQKNAAQANQGASETLLPSPKTLSNFTLTDDTGKPYTNDNLKGHWTILLFGFSHCGDVCPLSMTELNKMYLQLQNELPADKLPQVAFISVDPARDTPEVLHNYVKNYNPNFTGATGDAANLNIFVKEMGVYYAKKASQDPNVYGMDHSSQVFLFNPDGNWIGILNFPFQAAQLTKSYENLIHG